MKKEDIGQPYCYLCKKKFDTNELFVRVGTGKFVWGDNKHLDCSPDMIGDIRLKERRMNAIGFCPKCWLKVAGKEYDFEYEKNK